MRDVIKENDATKADDQARKEAFDYVCNLPISNKQKDELMELIKVCRMTARRTVV